MREMSRWLMLALSGFGLAGCLLDPAQVVRTDRAVDVPGLQGVWDDVGTKGRVALYIMRTDGARYSVVMTDQQTPDKRTTYDDVYLVKLPGRNADYVASLPASEANAEKGGRALLLVSVRNSMIEVRIPPDAEMKSDAALAKSAGVLIEGVVLLPGPADAVLTHYSKLAAKPFKPGFAFTRRGWFTTPSSQDITIKAADVAIAAGNSAQAANILGSLASRGHPEAQFRLAAMFANGIGIDKSPETAVLLFKSAHSGGHQQAAGALAKFLEVSALSGKADHGDAAEWYAIQSLRPEYRREMESALRNYTLAECKRRPASRRSDSDSDCSDRNTVFHVANAKKNAQIEADSNDLTESKTSLAVMKEKLTNSIDEAKRARSELQEQRAKQTGGRADTHGRPLFGASAQSASTGFIGLADSQLSAEAARLAAVKDCEGVTTNRPKDCAVVALLHSGACLAIATGPNRDTYHHWTASRKEASSQALHRCRQANDQNGACRLVATMCSDGMLRTSPPFYPETGR